MHTDLDNLDNQTPIVKQKRKINLLFLIPNIMIVVSVILNVLLAQEVKSLKKTLSILKAENTLQIGEEVPPILARGVDGSAISIKYADSPKPTVLYVFSPTCVWCERNLENLLSLVTAKRADYNFVGLSLTDKDIVRYVIQKHLNLPVGTSLSSETIKAYKLGGTPQTIVVSPEGKVMKSWVGGYGAEIATEIEQFFQVNLPGLTE